MDDFSSDSGFTKTSRSSSLNMKRKDRSLQGVPNALLTSRLNSLSLLPKDHGEELEDEDDEDESFSGTSLELPKLHDSLTPWRTNQDFKQIDAVSPSTTSKPSARNSLFSSGSVEVENLNRQLTNYKLKVRTLLGLIKQLNSEDGNGKRDSFYNNLLTTLSHDDEMELVRKQVSTLQMNYDDKNFELVQLKKDYENLIKELDTTKEEHEKTLEYVNEYMQHTDQVSTSIDELLNTMLNQLENLSPQECNALEKALEIPPNYVMVKMNALKGTFTKFLKELRELQRWQQEEQSAVANSTDMTDVTGKDSTIANESEMGAGLGNKSTLDPMMEAAINELHDDYDRFLHDIQDKLHESSDLEKSLFEKLSKQRSILSLLNKLYNESKSDSIPITNTWQSEKLQLSEKCNQLQEEMIAKNEQISSLQKKLESYNDLKLKEKRLQQEVIDEKNLLKLKEENWKNLFEELDNDLNELRAENTRVNKIISQQNEEFSLLEREKNEEITSLNNQSRVMLEKYNYLKENHNELSHNLKVYKFEMKNIEKENNQLRTYASQLKNNHGPTDSYEMEFESLKSHLILHLEALLNIFGKILQHTSVDQSLKKLRSIQRMHGASQTKKLQATLEMLYNFVETATDSIVQSYMSLLLSETQEKPETNFNDQATKDLEIRAQELQRKWLAERERRKLDITASEERISKLERENESLREQLYNLSVSSP